MKSKLSYKSKRNIVISAIIVVLIALIGTGTYFFTKGNSDQTEAYSNNGTQVGEIQGNAGQGEENTQGNQGEIVEPNLNQNQDGNLQGNSNGSSSNIGNSIENNSNISNNGTNGSITGNVPNEDYVTERVEEQEVLVSEDYEVAWSPLTIRANTTTSELGIVRPIIVAEKSTQNKEVVVGEEIEYILTVSNIGNLEGTAIVQDKAPEKTTFKADSIKINGVEAVHEDGSSYTENELEAGIELSVKPEEVITVSFTVVVNEKETITEEDKTVEIPTAGTIVNTAIVNEEETNQVKTPILHTEKKSEVYRNDKKVDVAKVGDTIKYIITVTNTTEENISVTTNIIDEVPEGTTLIEETISEDGVVEDGTISWNEITLVKGEQKEVSFSVTVNKDRTTSVKNIALVADMPTNEVENPVINIEAVKISKADKPLYEKGMIEYNITLTNKGNAEGKVIVTDNVPEGTTLVTDSILVDGNISENVIFEKNKDNLITWKDITVGTEKSVVLSFKVTVNVFNTDTKEIVNNTATLDDEPINNTTDEAKRVYLDVIGKKIWKDKDNAEKTRPVDGITIQLKANGKIIKTELINKTGNEWNYEFKKLPKYDEQGKEIKYTVDEVAVDGYAKNISEYTITNSLPNIEVEKSIYNLNNGAEVAKNTAITVKKGDIVGYKITVKNTGDVDLTNVVVTDEMSNNNKIYLNYQNAQNETNGTNTVASIDKLAINESKTYIVYYKVKDNDVKDASVNIENTAKAVGYFTNGNGQDETVEDTSEKVIVNILKSPKITAVKERVGSGKVEPGNTITYKITVKNEGNTNLTNVKVFDTMNNNPKGNSREVTITGLTVAGSNKSIPTKVNGSYNIGNLGIGQTAIITATYKVTENDMAETEKTITNTAKAEGLSDGNVTVKSEESKVNVKTIVWKSDISLKKTSQLIKVNPNSLVGATTAEYGDTIKYTITATNTGRKAGTVVVKDYIPAGTELVEYSKSNGTTNLSKSEHTALGAATTSNKFSKTLNVEGNNASTSIYFTVKVKAKPGSTVQNIATDGRDNSNVPEPGNKVEKVVAITKITETFQNSNVVIVMDRSRSMQQTADGKKNTILYEGTNQTRLAVAKKVINKYIIDKMDFAGGSEVSLIAFWGPNGNSTVDTNSYNYTYWNDVIGTAQTKSQATTLKNKINNIQVDLGTEPLSPTGTCISAALRTAKDEIVRLNTENPNNKNVVIFISDGKPEGDDDEANIPTYASQLKTAVTGGVEVYTIGFGANPDNDAEWKKYLQNTIASSTNNYYYAGSNNMDTVFNDLSSIISPATPVNVASIDGKVELTGIDTSKKVTINGTEKTIANWENKIVQSGTKYYVDLSKYAADTKITIEYYKSN